MVLGQEIVITDHVIDPVQDQGVDRNQGNVGVGGNATDLVRGLGIERDHHGIALDRKNHEKKENDPEVEIKDEAKGVEARNMKRQTRLKGKIPYER